MSNYLGNKYGELFDETPGFKGHLKRGWALTVLLASASVIVPTILVLKGINKLKGNYPKEEDDRLDELNNY